MLLLAGWVGDKPRLDLLGAVTGPSLRAVPPRHGWPFRAQAVSTPGGPLLTHLTGTHRALVDHTCLLLGHQQCPPHPTRPAGRGSEGAGGQGVYPPEPTSPIRPAPHPPGGLQPSGLPTSEMLLTRGGPQYGDFKWKRGRTLGHPETARKIIPENA